MNQTARVTISSIEPTELGHIHPAANIAGAAILLNIGERIGALPYIGDGKPVTAAGLAHTLKLPQSALSAYLKALTSAGLMESTEGPSEEFKASSSFSEMLHSVGYVSWTLNANRPYMDHAIEFFRNTPEARTKFHRDGHQIAITSQWMGADDFYPAARATIFALKPKRFVDLGAGSARLLIEVLLKFPKSTGVALDISPASCAAASDAAQRAGVADRLTIVERSIESVASDPAILDDADAVHGGFVFHDMLPHDEAVFEGVLRNSARALSKTKGRMLVTDAAPFVKNQRERMFSAAFGFLHHFCMGRRLLSEEEWAEKFRTNGFQSVECTRLPFPTARLYVANAT
jgi:DNA-binding transcriptional ArsR family regulator